MPALIAQLKIHLHYQEDMNESSSAKRLNGKVAIITGGASGFGKSTAALFLRHGAKVIIADVQDDLGRSLCQKLGSDQNISYLHCDVTSDSDLKSAVDFAVEKHGRLDVMFNNAGITGEMDPTILGTEAENFKKVFEVNVYGGFLGAKHAARVMIPNRSGVILFTASVAAVNGGGESPHAYAMSKHAVVGLMRNLCVELGEFGIRVNSISPCAIGTPLLRNALGFTEEVLEDVLRSSAILKGAVPTAEDVAEAALFLCSDESRVISGHNLVVDGGYSTANRSFSAAVIRKLSSV